MSKVCSTGKILVKLCVQGQKQKTKNIVVLPFSHMKSVLVPFESRGREAEYI